MKPVSQKVEKIDLEIAYWQEIADEVEELVDQGNAPREAVEVVAERRGCLITEQSPDTA